ncbi:MAG: PilZ domain-containing protein [bacterium]|nr:PilZ domain-containing protein [bacterium]
MKDRAARIKKNQRIVLKDGDDSHTGIITTLSKTGMSIKTEHVFHTFKVVDILVKIGQKVVPIKASIRWVNEAAGEEDDNWNEIGVSLQNPPPEYVRHFD